MRETEVIEILNSIFRDIFDDEDLIINRSTSPNNIEGWDSLMHINLILAIEKEFSVKFSIREVGGISNVSDIISKILECKPQI